MITRFIRCLVLLLFIVTTAGIAIAGDTDAKPGNAKNIFPDYSGTCTIRYFSDHNITENISDDDGGNVFSVIASGFYTKFDGDDNLYVVTTAHTFSDLYNKLINDKKELNKNINIQSKNLNLYLYGDNGICYCASIDLLKVITNSQTKEKKLIYNAQNIKFVHSTVGDKLNSSQGTSSEKEKYKIYGKDIAMIKLDPEQALNNVLNRGIDVKIKGEVKKTISSKTKIKYALEAGLLKPLKIFNIEEYLKKNSDKYIVDSPDTTNKNLREVFRAPPVDNFASSNARIKKFFRIPEKATIDSKPYAYPKFVWRNLDGFTLKICNFFIRQGGWGWRNIKDDKYCISKVNNLEEFSLINSMNMNSLNNLPHMKGYSYGEKYMIKSLVLEKNDYILGLDTDCKVGMSGSPITIKPKKIKDDKDDKDDSRGKVIAIVQGGPVDAADKSVNTWAIPTAYLREVYQSLWSPSTADKSKIDHFNNDNLFDQYLQTLTLLQGGYYISGSEIIRFTSYDWGGGTTSQQEFVQQNKRINAKIIEDGQRVNNNINNINQRIESEIKKIAYMPILQMNNMIFSLKGLDFPTSKAKPLNTKNNTYTLKQLLNNNNPDSIDNNVCKTIKTAFYYLCENSKDVSKGKINELVDNVKVIKHVVNSTHSNLILFTPSNISNDKFNNYIQELTYYDLLGYSSKNNDEYGVNGLKYDQDLNTSKFRLISIKSDDNKSNIIYFFNDYTKDIQLNMISSFFTKYLKYNNNDYYCWDSSSKGVYSLLELYMPFTNSEYSLMRKADASASSDSYIALGLSGRSVLAGADPISFSSTSLVENNGTFLGTVGVNKEISFNNASDKKLWLEWYFSILLTIASNQ